MKRKSCIIAATFFLLVGLALCFIPVSITTHPIGSPQLRSESNLQNIVVASILYAGDSEGKLPDSFEALYPEYIDVLEIFFARKNLRSNKTLYRKLSELSNPITYTPIEIIQEKLAPLMKNQSSYKIWKASETECIFHERPGLWKHGRILWRRIEFDGENWKEKGQGELEEDEIANFLSDPAIARAKSSK